MVDYYTSPYSKSKHDKFLSEAYLPPTEEQVLSGSDTSRGLFSDAQRSMIMYYILSIITFSEQGSKKKHG